MDPKSSRQIPAASPCARAAGGAPWERRAALQPLPRRRSRAASAELARTAPLAVARWLWGGDAGAPAGSTGLHKFRKQRCARLSLVLCSGELVGRSVVCRCWLRCALASPAAPRSLRRPVAAVAAPPCVLAAAPVAQVDPTALAARQTIQRRIRRMALTFTVCCPKPFGGSLPRDSMQQW